MKKMDLYSKIVLFFQHGGEFMYPIALVMAIGVAISLERYFYLARQTSANRRDYEKILPLLRAATHARDSGPRVEIEVGGVRDRHRWHCTLEPYAPPSGHRIRDGRATARSAAEHRAPHAVSRDVCERGDTARTARHGYRSDRCVHRGCVGRSRPRKRRCCRRAFRYR